MYRLVTQLNLGHIANGTRIGATRWARKRDVIVSSLSQNVLAISALNPVLYAPEHDVFELALGR